MKTWAMWTFGLIALSAVLKVLVLGVVLYPRKSGRIADMLDAIVLIAWLVWGACVIW